MKCNFPQREIVNLMRLPIWLRMLRVDVFNDRGKEVAQRIDVINRAYNSWIIPMGEIFLPFSVLNNKRESKENVFFYTGNVRTPVSYFRDLVTDSPRISAAIVNNLRARFIRFVRQTQLTKHIISVVRMYVCMRVHVNLRMVYWHSCR